MQHISELSKRNKEQYILSYVREQRQYANVYAAAGKVQRSSWDLSSNNSTEHVSTVHHAHAPTQPELSFGTPTLRARNDCNLSQDQKAIKDNAQSHHKSDNVCNSQTQPSGDRSKRRRRRNPPTKEVSSDSEEHKNRLSERRQRKKAKKEIMNPEINCRNSKKGEANKKKKGEGHTGFALLHGFSATNVGKNRLTLDYLIANRNGGVFKKGRASDPTKVNRKDTSHFTESQFLKGNSKDVVATRSNSSSSSSSRALARTRRKPISARIKGSVRKVSDKDETRSSTTSVPSASSTSRIRIRDQFNPADSIVWDIESRSGHLEDRVHPDPDQGTVLLNLPETLNSKLKVVSTQIPAIGAAESSSALSNLPLGTVEKLQGDASGSFLSLAPSESASQVPAKTTTSLRHSSRYFRTTAIPPQNTVNAPAVITPEAFTGRNSVIEDSPAKNIPESASDLYQHVITGTHLYQANSDSPSQLASQHHRQSTYWSEVGWDEPGPLFDSVYDGDDDYLLDFRDSMLPDTSLSSLTKGFNDQWVYDENLQHTPTFDYDEVPEPRDIYNPIPLQDSDLANSPLLDSRWDEWHYINIDPEQSCEPRGIVYDDLSHEDDASIAQISSVISGNAEEETGVAAAQFYQGRAILHGLGGPSNQGEGLNGLLAVEAEVASLLRKTHWAPQKF